MKKVKVISFLVFFVILLTGCDVGDIYYVYDKNYMKQVESNFDSKIKDPKIRDITNEILLSTQMRIKLSKIPNMTLLVIQSYKVSDELKDKLKNEKININFDSESRTYDTCDFINEKNWICKNFGGSGFGYEMKNGDLYKDSYKLIKKFSFGT